MPPAPTTSARESFAKRWLRRLWPWLRIYILICLVMMLLERFLVFPASRDGDWHPSGLNFEDVRFQAADGVALHGWFLEHPTPREVILFAHGNGGNLSHRAWLMERLRRELGVSVMIFDYRGYGKSEGLPDEPGILADARAARAWLARRTGKAEQDIVLMGESLGAAVLVDLAAKDGARGLVMQSTFSSLVDVAAYHYPWLPVRLLMRTRMNCMTKIGQYHGPVLQCHGTADTIVPIQFGRRLHEAVPDPKKMWVEMHGLDHNDDPWQYLGPALGQFLDRLKLESSL
jgi:fermentation-respiration switch protein FrsA (DUF1100 family)